MKQRRAREKSTQVKTDINLCLLFALCLHRICARIHAQRTHHVLTGNVAELDVGTIGLDSKWRLSVSALSATGERLRLHNLFALIDSSVLAQFCSSHR